MHSSSHPENAGSALTEPTRHRSWTRLTDRVFFAASAACSAISLLLILAIGAGLYYQSALARHAFGWSILGSTTWDVVHDIYGALPYIYGTLVSSFLALVIAVPVGVGAAIYLAEIAPPWLAAPISFVIELIAAVPSVIFGLWGFFVMAPWLKDHVDPCLMSRFGTLPLFQGPAYATSVLAAATILAIMILPLVTSVSREIMRSLPASQRDGARALGATRWETIRSVVLRASTSGIIGAVILAFGRALGETMAVVMVIGNNPTISKSLLQPGYTMPALLANEFNEAFTIPMQRSALIEIAFILFVITLIVNALARVLILLTTSQTRESSDTAAGRAREKIIPVLTEVARWLCILVAAGIAAAIVVSDLRRNGVVGLFGPVELFLLFVALIRVATMTTQGTRHWSAWRAFNDRAVSGVMLICALLCCVVLGLLLFHVTVQGAGSLNATFFTELPKSPDDPTGGIKNAIIGTFLLVAIAGVIGIPIGLLAGVYLAEFRTSHFGGVLRFSSDVLNGIPSVVIGMFAYALFVLPIQQFSALAGGGALAIMVIPIVARTTEEMLRLVPDSVREAALGLGATHSQMVRMVVLPAARAGVVTGVLLAIARIAGETAPLLFTAFGNEQVSVDLRQPISSITMIIYRYATTGYGNWMNQAWGAAVVLLALVLAISIAARIATRSRYRLT